MLGNFLTDKDVSVDRDFELPRDIVNTMTYRQSEASGSKLEEDQCVYGQKERQNSKENFYA